MANNIYIGARYVPIFAGEWNSETAYEPLTVVNYYNASYTSKKDVPAGVVPTNTSYWAMTGNYNQQVEEYRQMVVELQKKAEMKQLGNCRFVCVGDSYAEGYNPDTGTVTANGWPAKLKAKLGINDTDFFVTYTGGAGFSSERQGGGFAAQLTALIPSVTEPDTIDYVIVMGGHNDRNSTTDLVYAGIQAFYNTAHAAFPNAKIYAGMCAWDGNYQMQNQINDVLTRYMDGIRNYAPAMFYMSGIENILLNIGSMLASDKKHPTVAGNEALAAGVIQTLNGYSDILSTIDGMTINPTSGITISGLGLAARNYNGIIKLVMTRTQFDYDEAVTVGGHGGRLLLGDAVNFPRSADASAISSWYSTTVLIREVSNPDDARFRYVPADVGFFEGKLCVVFYNLNAAEKNWENLVINRIEIPQMTLIINAHA